MWLLHCLDAERLMAHLQLTIQTIKHCGRLCDGASLLHRFNWKTTGSYYVAYGTANDTIEVTPGFVRIGIQAKGW